MASHALDNPVWQALTTRQAGFALGGEHVKRYPPQMAPFVAVPTGASQAMHELAELVEGGEIVCLVGVAPPLSAEWKLEKRVEALQMTRSFRIEQTEDEVEIVRLSDADAPAMLALTSLVYPAFFRKHTAELGAYIGIYQDGKLAAMAGERMHLTGYQEISAVCTHPGFLGRGYAGRLVGHLVNAILERGDTPFLHVEGDNERAKSLYERLGFSARRSIPVWFIRRQG